jgi:hypothetical protein
VISKEDEKLILLSKIAKGAALPTEFRKIFGHYGLNGFELSSRRFSEYTDKELLKLAEPVKSFVCNKDVKLEDYLNAGSVNPYWAYCALKEELRDCGLQIVAKLRFEILNRWGEKAFHMTYEELIKI